MSCDPNPLQDADDGYRPCGLTGVDITDWSEPATEPIALGERAEVSDPEANAPKPDCRIMREPAMAVFVHHCYELRRGLRNLILHTAPTRHRERMRAQLEQLGAAYHFVELGAKRVNLFFGHQPQVAIIKSFGDKSLAEYTPEEDFILGTMLGYDDLQQCERYLVRSAQYRRQGAASENRTHSCHCGRGDCGCATGQGCNCDA